MINPLNELSAVYMQHIAEESPEEQEARITQIVKAIRYRARKSGQPLSKAYNDYIGSVQVSSSDRQAVKQKLGLLAGSGNQDDGGLALKQRPEMKEELAVEAKIDDVRDAKLKRAGIDAAARERVKRTMRTARANPDSGKSVLSKQMSSPEQKDRIRRRAHRYTDTLNKDAKDIRRGKTDGPQFQGKTGAERLAQVKREKRMKESFSNWRTDLIEVIDNSYDLKSSKPKTDTKSMEKIGDKKVNNKVVINPPMKEAFEEIGGTIIEMSDINEVSSHLVHTASMKADEERRKAAVTGDKVRAAAKAAQSSRLYKKVGPLKAKERMAEAHNEPTADYQKAKKLNSPASPVGGQRPPKSMDPRKKGKVDSLTGLPEGYGAPGNNPGSGEKAVARTKAFMDKKGMKGAPGLDAMAARKAEHEAKRGVKKEEVEIVDEKFSMAADPSKRESPRPTFKAQDSKKMKLRSKAIKAVGTQRRQDKETGVTEEVLSERPYQITGPHSYTSGDGDPRDDVRIKNTATNVGKPMKSRVRARNKAERMNQEYGASVYRVHKVDEEIDVTKQSSKRKSLGRGSSIKDGAKKTGYESPKEFRDTEKKFAKEEFIAETAVEFFMNEGINEEGLEIFIEELGLEGFVEFIGELAEETFLSEARAAKRRTGGKSYAEVKAEIDAREKAKAEKKAAAKPAPKAAVATAKAKQPTKKPVRDAIARGVFRAVDAYKKGMERHNMAMSTAKKAASVAGKGASEFGKGFASGVKGGVKFAKDVKKAVSEDKRFSNWRDDFAESHPNPTPQMYDPERLRKATSTPSSFDDKEHREASRAKKIRDRTKTGDEGSEIAKKKVKGPKLMGEKLNLKTADMGDVIDDFYKSDAPQFKGKSKKKIRQMAIAAKLGAEDMSEAAKDQSDKQLDKGMKTTYKAQGEIANADYNKYKDGRDERMSARLRARRKDIMDTQHQRAKDKTERLKKLLNMEELVDEESRQPKKVRGAKPTEGELHQQRIRKANERILKHGLTSKEKKETQARSKYYSSRD